MRLGEETRGKSPAAIGGRRLGGLVAGIAALSVWGVGATAHAQMAGVATQGDNGIRVGAGRLHPLFGFETRYDSFVGYSQEAQQTVGEAPAGTGDLILHIKPGLELKVPSDSVQIGARFQVDYNAYMGAQESWTTDQSKTAAALDFNAVINPKGDTKVNVDERFNRSDVNTNLELGTLTISDRNDAGVHLAITPGGGALLLEPGFTNTYEHFEPRTAEGDSTVTRYDYWENTASLSVGYKVTPKSAFLLDSSLAFRNFEREISQQFDSTNLRVTAGFVGMVMPRVALTLKAGLGQQFEDNGAQTAVGQAEIGYLYSEETQVRLGYARAFEPSPSAAMYYTDDRVYLEAMSRFDGKLGLVAGVSFDRLGFPAKGRGTDDQIGFHIGPDWSFNSVVTAGLSYAYTDRTSTAEVGGIEYNRHEFGGHVVIYY